MLTTALCIGSCALSAAYIAYRDTHREETRFINNWIDLMQQCQLYTKAGYTFKLDTLQKTPYGFRATVGIPKAMCFKTFQEATPLIEDGLGILIEPTHNKFKRTIDLKVATEPISDLEEFKPVKCKPHEIYCGKTFFHEDLLFDMNSVPHGLITGITGSGKTSLSYIILTNLFHFHSRKDVEAYLIQTSDKKDLQKFRDVENVCYYADTYEKARDVLRHLCTEMAERNMHITDKHRLNDIVGYNKKFPNDKLSYKWIVFDEFALMMPGDKKTDPYYEIKTECLTLANRLTLQGRSAGIFLISALQRPDSNNMPPSIKSMFNVRIAFRQATIASSLVVVDSDRAVGLPNREALILADKDYRIKTVFLDDTLIEKYIGHKRLKRPRYVNLGQPYSIEDYELDNMGA